MLNDFLFLTLSLLALGSAGGMIYFHQPINSALSFIVTLLSIAGLFALLGGSFLFLVQIIIYGGAVVALILFIIMFLNIKEENLPSEPHKNRWLLLSILLIFPMGAYLVERVASTTFEHHHIEDFGNIYALGKTLYSQWVLPFEMISILLLIALVGVVVLAKKEKYHD